MRAARFAAQLGLRRGPGRGRGDDGDGRADRDRGRRARPGRAREADARAPIPRCGLRLLVDTGLADHVLPELPALRLEIDEHHRHKDVYEHTLTVLEQAIALEDGPDGPVPGPDLVLRLAALLHDIGKPATRRFEPGGGVSFHHHEVVGAKLAAAAAAGAALRQGHRQAGGPARRAAPALPRLRRRRSGPTPPCAATSRTPARCSPRLHKLTRADCTTRNRRKAERLAAAYDDLEARIERSRSRRSSTRSGPTSTATRSWRCSASRPAARSAQAWTYLKDLRLERGPLPRTSRARSS